MDIKLFLNGNYYTLSNLAGVPRIGETISVDAKSYIITNVEWATVTHGLPHVKKLSEIIICVKEVEKQGLKIIGYCHKDDLGEVVSITLDVKVDDERETDFCIQKANVELKYDTATQGFIDMYLYNGFVAKDTAEADGLDWECIEHFTFSKEEKYELIAYVKDNNLLEKAD